MFSYFVPISLMVLAGFGLGLLVGWMAWRSRSRSVSSSTRVGRPDPTPTPDSPKADEPGESESSQAEPGDSDAVKVWEIEEVVPGERQGSNVTPINVARFRNR